jgi:hypothetical protein
MIIEKIMRDNYIHDIGQLNYGDVVFEVGSTMMDTVFVNFPIEFQQIYIESLDDWKPICYWATVIMGHDSGKPFTTHISLNDSGILVGEAYHNDHCLFRYDEGLYEWFDKNREKFPVISKWLRGNIAKK